MLILFLFLTANLHSVHTRQELCYQEPGDSYSGYINTTDRGLACENWNKQTLIELDQELTHNYCRVVLEMSKGRPFCVVSGQKHQCDVPRCDKASLKFTGYGIIMSRTEQSANNLKLKPIIMQAIKLYFKVEKVQFSKAILVQVQSKNDPQQRFSIVLQNGFLKLEINLDSYNTERMIFGGPISAKDVHFVSVNRSYENVVLRLNNTVTNYTLVNKDTTFLVSPYQVLIGDNYHGCMTGLSVGSWVQKKNQIKMYLDKPLNFYTGYDIDQFQIQRKNNGTPVQDQCMFAPPTFIKDIASGVPEYDFGNSVEEEARVGTDIVSKRGTLDTTSIIIISSALGVIFFLTALVLVCMRRNQNLYTPQGYNLEVM